MTAGTQKIPEKEIYQKNKNNRFVFKNQEWQFRIGLYSIKLTHSFDRIVDDDGGRSDVGESASGAGDNKCLVIDASDLFSIRPRRGLEYLFET